jgi:hypothetical protein
MVFAIFHWLQPETVEEIIQNSMLFEEYYILGWNDM